MGSNNKYSNKLAEDDSDDDGDCDSMVELGQIAILGSSEPRLDTEAPRPT